MILIRRDGDSFDIKDGKGDTVLYEGDMENNTIRALLPEGSTFYGFHFNPFTLNSGREGFVVFCMDRQWYLGADEAGNCHSVNAYGKLIDLKIADTIGIFKGREAFLSGRGYIWDRTLPGILMEFKAVPTAEKEKLSDLAEEALRQTADREYHRDLEDRGVKNIVRYGIAFSGKNVEVRISL